jgi:hypothetical protein
VSPQERWILIRPIFCVRTPPTSAVTA